MVLFILIIIAAIVLWFWLTFLFKPTGTILDRMIKHTERTLKGEDEEE